MQHSTITEVSTILWRESWCVCLNRIVQTWCCFSGCCLWARGRGTWSTARSSKSLVWFVKSSSKTNAVDGHWAGEDRTGLTGLWCCCRQDKEVVTCFLPAMMSVVVDDNIFTVEQKLPSEEKSSQVYPTLLPDAFYRYVTDTFLFL